MTTVWITTEYFYDSDDGHSFESSVLHVAATREAAVMATIARWIDREPNDQEWGDDRYSRKPKPEGWTHETDHSILVLKGGGEVWIYEHEVEE